MTWNITLEVVDCAATSTLLSNAEIKMGTAVLGSTDVSGRYVATLDDYNTWPIFKVSKDNYIARSFTFDKDTYIGTIQTVCLNHSPYPDGADPTAPGQPGEPLGGDGGCFIVTATTGSPESVEVKRLRNLRDRVSTMSRLGAQLIDAIYDEYYQFSPAIAAKLQQDAVAKEAVLQNVVRPLLAWYTLAGTLGLEQADQKTIDRAAQDVLDACPQQLGGRMIIGLLEAIRAGEALPASTSPVLLDLSSRITQLPLASWAILDPLIRAWRSATEQLDVVDEVAQWLACAPLEALTPSSDPNSLDVELGVLAGFLNFRPTVRPQLGKRLLAAWPDAAVALEQAGFVS